MTRINMHLKDLLSGIDHERISERYLDYDIACLSCDSRTTQPESLFVALSGSQYNGSDYIKDAVARGATVVVQSDNSKIPAELTDRVCVLKVRDPKQFLHEAARRFYGNPSAQVRVFGVTGTNGKTTITYLLESIAHAARHKCGVIGTINYRIGQEILPSKNTTPGFLENQKYLARLVKEQVDYCFMEVSSHALDQGRVDLVDFKIAIFTNLTGDHLDYHKTMEDYFQAKTLLFRNLSPEATAVINIDDDYGQRLLKLTKAKVLKYGLLPEANIRAENIEFSYGGSTMKIVTPAGDFELKTRLIGMHNVYNILAAVGACVGDGVSLESIKAGLESLKLIPGRLEAVDCGQDFFVFIDYAHTEDGLRNVLEALHATGDTKITTVFGCGGDRDRGKRPKMGKVAGELSDHCVVTTDNPRSEEPEAIVKEIVVGFDRQNFEVIVDRTKAIHRALGSAKKGEVVLIAGKGHETYQIFKDRVIDYDERIVIADFFKKR
jgi:UDP-N-acetylmuramoyl-L-alanyl-D-glutamate--2,6-diaminopimelate ligase